jgi:hypothetical protein
MAAGVTAKLWDFMDVVKVVEEWEANQHLAMSASGEYVMAVSPLDIQLSRIESEAINRFGDPNIPSQIPAYLAQTGITTLSEEQRNAVLQTRSAELTMHALHMHYQTADDAWVSPEDFQKLDLQYAYARLIGELPTPAIAALADDENKQFEETRNLATGMAKSFVQDVDSHLADPPTVYSVAAVAP